MKRISAALILAGALAAHSSANAQGSTLHVACKGNDIGAEVTINGQFKGECPLEARVDAGTVKLRLVKKVDNQRERIFEQDIRIGDGVVKKVDAVLSAPRLIAAEQGRGNHGRSTTNASAASAQPGRPVQTGTTAAQAIAASRPPVPLAISEDLWNIIETSEAYRNLPQPRGIKVVSETKQDTEYTGSKSKSLPNPATKTVSTTRVIAPVGDKCTMTVTNAVTDGKPDTAAQTYLCGHIFLGLIVGGKPMSIVSSIDKLEGSLFPMRIGARMTMQYQAAFVADRKYDSRHAADCAVVDRLAAQDLNPGLTGTAWKVHCKSSYNVDNVSEIDDYYLEDLVVMLSSIGAYDTSKKASVLPSAGTQTLIEAEGEYGSRNITSYASHRWETGGNYEVPAPVAVAAARSNDTRPTATREAPAQREQAQLAGSTSEATPAQQLSAAAAGDTSAMVSLGARYEAGKGVTQNYVQAAQWYQKAAVAGDPAGMAGLGSMYLNGTGIPKDHEQARVLFTKAAEAGNGRGINGIGVLYDNGYGGMPKDPAQAVVWFEKAAATGEWRGMLNLGVAYAKGDGVAKNDIEAVSWYREAAEAGSAEGMFSLGTMYVNGKGVAENNAEAVSWYRKAAAAGSVKAMYELGVHYATGLGVAKNEAEAVSWYRKGALAGFAPAMTNYGYYLFAGIGVAKNEDEGIAWERKAAALGDAQGIRNLRRSLAEQARRNNPQNAGKAQAEEPAGGSGFFGAVLGGLTSRYVDRVASQINSATAGTSGVGGAAMSALGGVSTQLARETKEQIARDMGGNGSTGGMAGALLGTAVGSGSRAGAIAALSSSTSNLTGSALSGSTGSGAGTGGAGGAGCCTSDSERIADNRARGAPDNFETNNERICRERKARAYCEAGVTERRLNLGGLEKFGSPGGNATSASAPVKATSAQEQICRAAYQGVTDDPQFDWACKNAQFNKCLDEATKIPTYRVQTRAVCMQLDQSLRALNSGTAASYCPLYCGR